MRKILGIVALALLLIGMMISTTNLRIGHAAAQTDINTAIDKGLAYLNSTQNSDGSWSGFPVATTAMAVLAFENAPNSHYGWNLTDPYHTAVQNGLNWLFSHASVISISSSKSAGNPDTNGNGFGIGWYGDGNVQVYETPMVLMAIIASNAPTNVTTTGAANVTGRTYHDIAQDVVDWIAWAQNSIAANGQYEGGWRYTPQSGDSDNSVSQWPVLGLMAAQLWGINASAWVQTELLKWTNTTQSLVGNYSTNSVYGAFDYQPGRKLDTPADSAAGILELTYCGVNKTDPRIIAAQGYLNRDWNPNGICPNGDDYGWNWNIGDLYDMYAVMKACRLMMPQLPPNIPQFIVNYTGSPSVEWYNGTGQYADALVANQGPAHGWPNGSWNNWVSYVPEGGDVSFMLGTAWGTLILEFVPVKVTYQFTVTVKNATNSNPIAGAQVQAEGPETRLGTTDINGQIVFAGIQAGAYQVNASMTGYLPSSPVMVSVISDTAITIKLQPEPSLPVPEVPYGTIAAILSMMMALMGCLAMPRLKKKLQ